MGEGLIVEKAYAKINLGLKVLKRRKDGFHEICGIVQSIDLADALHFRESDENRLTCTDPGLSIAADNLVVQAMKLFNTHLQVTPRPFHLHLEKIIPSGAGLGGGSADAAAALRGLNRLYRMPFSMDALREMAACLGSDVPFLVDGGTALMRGRGEIVEPLRWNGETTYLLVYPGVEVSTAWAYRQVKAGLTLDSPYLKFIASLSGGCVDHESLILLLENDFQPVVERAYPIVAELSSQLRVAGALACSISGSGSTVYGIFDDRTVACQARQEIQGKGFQTFLCRPLLPTINAIQQNRY